MTLRERYLTGQGVHAIPAGVMIETRSALSSLYLRAVTEHNGTSYSISSSLHGERKFKCFIPCTELDRYFKMSPMLAKVYWPELRIC